MTSHVPFRPQVSYSELEAMLGTWRETTKEICNDQAYDSIARLTEYAHPEKMEDDWAEGRWNSFYLPVRRMGKRICIPVTIIQQSKPEPAFFLNTSNAGVTIKRGSEGAALYGALIQDAERLVPLLKAASETVLRGVPYDIRTGKIKRKYAIQKLERRKPYMAAKEADRIREAYAAHEKKGLKGAAISVNDYLAVAARCYRAAFGEKANGTPREMYAYFADGRHGGMLDIDGKSSKAFTQWLESDQWSGSHPFEIKYSSYHHGICLFPPGGRFGNERYRLNITDLVYTPEFLSMVQELMRAGIPFSTDNLQKTLDFQTGEAWMAVNREGGDCFRYVPSRENHKTYFSHIIWDELCMPAWK